ncbi:hypothetical protein LguiA_007796 [Lonicera macranthoides]
MSRQLKNVYVCFLKKYKSQSGTINLRLKEYIFTLNGNHSRLRPCSILPTTVVLLSQQFIFSQEELIEALS